MSDIKAVIFDLDGCLVDSETHALDVLAAELRDEGIEHVSAAMLRERFLGVSITRICDHIEQQTQRPCPAGFIERFEEKLFARYRRKLQVIDGAPQLLADLSARGVATAIASGSSVRRLGVTLECVDLAHHFRDRAFSADLVANGKPAPDLFQLAALSLGVAPESCAVMEDSPHGVTGAVAAGMRAIGFVGGTHLDGITQAHGRRLAAAGASAVLENMDGMLAALLNLTPESASA